MITCTKNMHHAWNKLSCVVICRILLIMIPALISFFVLVHSGCPRARRRPLCTSRLRTARQNCLSCTSRWRTLGGIRLRKAQCSSATCVRRCIRMLRPARILNFYSLKHPFAPHYSPQNLQQGYVARFYSGDSGESFLSGFQSVCYLSTFRLRCTLTFAMIQVGLILLYLIRAINNTVYNGRHAAYKILTFLRETGMILERWMCEKNSHQCFRLFSVLIYTERLIITLEVCFPITQSVWTLVASLLHYDSH